MNELVSYVDRIRERTMRLVACVPPDRIDWTFKEGKFTFGDVMRHLASIERWMFAENAMQRPSRYPPASFDRKERERWQVSQRSSRSSARHRKALPRPPRL